MGTLGQVVLKWLEEGPASAKELANRIGASPNTVWVTLNKLKRRNKVINVKRGEWALAPENAVCNTDAAGVKKSTRRLAEMERVLQLAYRALTEGMADVPAEERNSECARLRVEAKREIRRVLGMGNEDGQTE